MMLPFAHRPALTSLARTWPSKSSAAPDKLKYWKLFQSIKSPFVRGLKAYIFQSTNNQLGSVLHGLRALNLLHKLLLSRLQNKT
jgi:hypothetical protein